MKSALKIALLVVISSSVANVYAEQESTHKHYKATMKGESHGSSTTEAAVDKKSEENPKHKHYKATMPVESHQDFVEGDYSESADEESEPTHKHYKGTMKGEKHNQ
tara:strand:+ start:7083 stop:7400 length:318 start_codon:yes stop_codon:yes gene_type:complete